MLLELLAACAISAKAEALVAAAREWVVKAPIYDPSYVEIPYPGGDPGAHRGVCTDLVVRAFRTLGIDLQLLVQEDIRTAPDEYHIRRPDPNIDHRRVRNLVVFFSRHAQALPVDSGYCPGDIVVWDLNGDGKPNHIGIVSDKKGSSGNPLVIHHLGHTPKEDDCLTNWTILHHFRWRWGDSSESEATAYRTGRGPMRVASKQNLHGGGFVASSEDLFGSIGTSL